MALAALARRCAGRRPVGVPVHDGAAAHRARDRLPGQPGRRAVSATDELRALVQRYARAADERDVDVLDRAVPSRRDDRRRARRADRRRVARHDARAARVPDEHARARRSAHRARRRRRPRAGSTRTPSCTSSATRRPGQGDLTLGIRYLDTVDARRRPLGASAHRVAAHALDALTLSAIASAAASRPGRRAGRLAVVDRHRAVHDRGAEADRALLKPAAAAGQVVDERGHRRADASPGRTR